MQFRTDSVQIRISSMRREEFSPALYRPGVISLVRMVWGTLGAGLMLACIGIMSHATGVSVLYPPLAATCFINATCVFLRVARPKSVIVGHFVASIGGVCGVWIVETLAGGLEFAVAFKLGAAVLLASLLMQLFDADHPPAAATAAIPAILPLPMPEYLLPVHMAWGATLAVLFAMAWNRVWFVFPNKDTEYSGSNWGLFMPKPQVVGLVLCTTSFVLLCCQSWTLICGVAGTFGMVFGVGIMGTHHLWHIRLDDN